MDNTPTPTDDGITPKEKVPFTIKSATLVRSIEQQTAIVQRELDDLARLQSAVEKKQNSVLINEKLLADMQIEADKLPER